MKSILDENQTKIFNYNEIKSGVTEEINPRELASEIMDYDVVKDLREAKDNPNPVKIDTDKIIEEKFLSKKLSDNKVVEKSWKNPFIPSQKNVRGYEINNHPF